VGYESRSKKKKRKKKKQQQKKGGETKQCGRDALKHFFFPVVALWRGVAQAQGLARLTPRPALPTLSKKEKKKRDEPISFLFLG
jgi:hypothetical protein